MKPELDKLGIKLFLVSIGTLERSKEFVKATGFPAENLFCDPDNISYDALSLKAGVGATFFSFETPLAIKKRMDEGRDGDLKEIMPRWTPWIPPKTEQAFQQGGIFVFEGTRCVLDHFDKATGAHADFAMVLDTAKNYNLAAEACAANPTPSTPPTQ